MYLARARVLNPTDCKDFPCDWCGSFFVNVRVRANHARNCLLRQKLGRIALWIRLERRGQDGKEEGSKRGLAEIMSVSAATSLALMLIIDGGLTETTCRTEHHRPPPTKTAHERWRRYQRQQRRCSAGSGPRLLGAQSASRRHCLREMHHNTFRRRRREERQAGATPPWMCKKGTHLPTAPGMPLRDSVQTLRIEGRGMCTNRDRSDGHAGKGAHERPRCCNWLIQAQVQLSDEWPGLGVDTYADRFDRGQNRGGHPECNGVLWRAQGRGANFRCNAMAIGGGETAVGMDQGATQKDRERERQGEGQGKAERRRRVHGLRRKVGVEPSFLRLCGSYSLLPSFTNLLFVCCTIADWQSDFCPEIWVIALFFFGTVLLAERCVSLPGLRGEGPLHAGQEVQQRSQRICVWGLCRPARCSRPPWAASHRVQTLAGARGSWIPLFTRRDDDEGDLQTVQPRRRGGCRKALARGRYFYGLFQLRRSGGPWFCCSLAMRSCVVLPWSDPAFPQVIESDSSKNHAEITAAEESAAVTFDRESKENEIEKAKKEKEVEYKTKKAEGLDRTLTELSSDKEGVQSERDAIHSYLGELEKQCVVVPETYAERKGHHEAEIAGLKEALSILSGGEVLVQQKSRRTFLHQHSVA